MEEDRKSFKSSFWFAVCNFIQKSVMILTVPIFTRIMTPDEYGMTAVYQSWSNVLTIVVTLSLSYGVFNNGMLHYKDDRDRYVSSMQGLSTISGVVFFLFFLLFQKSLTKLIGLPEKIIIIMFLSFIFQPSFEYWSARSRYEYRYKGLLIATIVYAFLNVSIPVFAVLRATHNLGEIRILSTQAVMIMYAVVFYFYNLKKGKAFYVKEYWKYALWFNLPLLPNYLSNIILNQSDRIMISNYCGDALAGIYSVACYCQTGLTIITGAISSAFVPWLYEKLEKKEYIQIRKRSEYLLIVLGYFTWVIISCAPEIIKILASEEYYDAVWVVAPVVIGTYFTSMYMLSANVEIYYAKRVFMSCATMIAAMLNVVLNFIFIPIFGYIACAYTTVFCYFVYGITHYMFMNKIKTEQGTVKQFHMYDIKHNMLIYSVVIFLSVIQMFFYHMPILRYMFVVLITGAIPAFRRKSYVK